MDELPISPLIPSPPSPLPFHLASPLPCSPQSIHPPSIQISVGYPPKYSICSDRFYTCFCDGRSFINMWISSFPKAWKVLISSLQHTVITMAFDISAGCCVCHVYSICVYMHKYITRIVSLHRHSHEEKEREREVVTAPLKMCTVASVSFL